MDQMDNYLNVRTAQDMINMGVVPKTSSQIASLVALLRLQALRDRSLSMVTPTMLGTWLPVVRVETVGPEVNDPDLIKKYSEGRRHDKVRGRGMLDNGTNLEGMLGQIVTTNTRYGIGVKFDNYSQGTTLGDNLSSRSGLWVKPENITILLQEPIEEYLLSPGVAVGEDLGHMVRFTQDVDFKVSSYSGSKTVSVKNGQTGQLVGYDASNSSLTVRVGESKGANDLTMKLSDAAIALQVSSLGQMLPRNKEDEVKKQSIMDFLPKTILPYHNNKAYDIRNVAENVIIGLLMGSDMVLHGPVGSGKTTTAKDIVSVIQDAQRYMFVVGYEEEDGGRCQVNCSPYSLMSADFASVVKACPECMIKFDRNHDYRITGRFDMSDPSSIPVVVVGYREGFGIEFVKAVDLRDSDLAGYAIPDMSGDRRRSNVDPERLTPGSLQRTNNGILLLSEFDKLSPGGQNSLLDALSDREAKPDELRFIWPADALVIGTANDVAMLSAPVNDRMLYFYVGYSLDVDERMEMSRRSYHKIFESPGDVPIPDVHRMQPLDLERQIIMPTIIERAMHNLAIKFLQEYNGEGKYSSMDSGRTSINDANNASRAKLIVDQVFYSDTPSIVTTQYAIFGMQYAVCSRIESSDSNTIDSSAKAMNEWISQKFPEALKQEIDVWWCQAKQHVAIYGNQIQGYFENFEAEIESYKQNINNALAPYAAVDAAFSQPSNDRLQIAKIKYPFMSYLMNDENQTGMAHIPKGQLLELVGFYIGCMDQCKCK